ncbi:MAG TPA: hypothetical protein VN805_17380 [Caulobacteraceae bacterium]|nr:hypothetical protein [Caulobacteraceae bacterium]
MRAVSGCVVVGVVIALAGCHPSQPSSQSAASVTATPAPPALWSVAAQNDQGKTIKTILVCADDGIRTAFTQPLPSVSGEPCGLVAPTVQSGGRFAARCRSAGHLLDIQAQTSGDPTSDFTVKLLIQTDVTAQPAFAQAVHYHRVGACPSDWTTGDAAAPGATMATNSLSGASHPLSAPAPAS